MRPIHEIIKERPWLGWVLFIGTAVIVFMLGLLASSVVERRAEAIFAYTPQLTFPQFEPDNAVWGEYFPRQYESYLRTSQTDFRSRHGGSVLVDMLEEYPAFVILWAGYPFSIDYRQGRGHYYAMEDLYNSLRPGSPGPGKPSPLPNTCWTCKSSDVPGLMNEIGIAEFYRGTWDTKGSRVVNPMGCVDCHDSRTMNLTITRPALVEAFESMGKDITRATHQEMRSLVCAQCHVEYYFNDQIEEGVQYLVLPWRDGLSVEDIEYYFDSMEFSDWTHGLSRAPLLKAQHPDYEIYLTGTHAARGVSCADCHMPFISEGGLKFTDHHMQSPLNNITNSCQVCHREDTERLLKDVYSRQDKIHESRKVLEDNLVRAHIEAQKAWELGATEEEMEEILYDIRSAQWRWDFAAAGHGNSFHSPVETGRIISLGIGIAQEARIKLARVLASYGYIGEVPLPDISTKAKAQSYIGLDMERKEAEKKVFLEEVLPQWLRGEEDDR